MNVIVLTGRLGNRIETKQYGNSSALNFSIAVQRPYKDKSGNYITDWFNCHSFNENIVKNVSKWLHQGDRISIQGAVEVNQTEKGTYFNVNVSQITLLETKEDRKNNEGQQSQAPKQENNNIQQNNANVNPDDFPF